MKLYAQQGYGTGSEDRNRILAGLRGGYLHGAIYSPKDYGAERTVEALNVLARDFPAKDRLFDPQFYAAIMAHEPDGRFGKLMSGDYPYFEPRRRAQLESENRVRADLQACLQFQNNLQVTAAIAPNIVIRQRFNSIEAVIAKNFIRNAKEIWTGIDKTRPVYATLAMDAEALQDRNELNEFLAEITILEQPPDGFYLLVNNPSSGISPELVDPRTLAGWLYLNHSLKLNGFGVINGFSDILTPFLSAAGGDAGATGWYSTQKVFSMDRFAPPTPGGRRPVLRYLSKALLNSIRFDEFHRLRGAFPDIVNGLPTDTYYDEEAGSQPEDQLQEILQTWNSIADFAGENEPPELSQCLAWIQASKEFYGQINMSPGMRLVGRSNGSHLESLESGLRLFAELAEIEL